MTSAFDSVGAFLNMGGYAVYVWSSYAVVTITIVLNIVFAVTRLRRTQAMLRQRLLLEDASDESESETRV